MLCSIRFLARQGLALRGDATEEDGNFLQLLQLASFHDPLMSEWLKQKVHKYTSHKIQNEFLELMASDVLVDISSQIHQSPYIT